MIRQSELYSFPGMNMHADVFSSTPVNLSSRIENCGAGSIWPAIVADYSDEFIRQGRVPEVEEEILVGIPGQLRPLVYLKTLQVKSNMDTTSYSSLLKKAKISALKEHAALIQSLGLPDELKEIMQVFDFCIREVVVDKSEELLPSNFVIGISPLVAGLAELSKPEILALLFKFNALFARLFKDEFFYKASRTLEDVVSEVFVHISKQGIDLTTFYKSVLFSLFVSVEDTEVLMRILDFVVFEGFDYYHRLIGAAFKENQEKLLGIDGDELNEFICSELLGSISQKTLTLSVGIEPSFIKYENEFHLMNANQMSGNHQELSNLKEANDDLVLKISELKQKTESLTKTQTEILGQGDEYSQKLQAAQEKKSELTGVAHTLQERYAHLTMKENLSNTIKANKDISRGNAELESQIAELQKQVAKRKAQLDKLSPGPAPGTSE